ncbi:MAG: nuclear transport factor 2 family protein [Wenzhouxiangella sp.]|jgi:hypothetical protein|nr:nuclear transport factor 2 family protein [Wenzhouxiangella sp.]
MASLKTYLLLVLLLLSGAALAEEGADAAEIRELLDAFLEGASTNDAQMHDRFWAESLVYTSSSGLRFGKSEIMGGLAEAAANEEAGPVYTAEDVNIRLLDKIAIVTFRLMAKGIGGEVEGQFYNTGVLQLLDEEWQAITWQATRILDSDE